MHGALRGVERRGGDERANYYDPGAISVAAFRDDETALVSHAPRGRGSPINPARGDLRGRDASRRLIKTASALLRGRRGRNEPENARSGRAMFARAKPGPALYGSVRAVPRGTGLRRIIIPFQVKAGLYLAMWVSRGKPRSPPGRISRFAALRTSPIRRDRVSSLLSAPRDSEGADERPRPG